MRRAFAGLRAARIRPGRAVRAAGAGAAVLLLAACGPEAGHGALDEVAATTEVTTTAAATTPPTTPPATPAPTTPAPTPAASPTPVRVAVPAVTGMTASRATAALTAAGLRWTTATLRTSRYAAGPRHRRHRHGGAGPAGGPHDAAPAGAATYRRAVQLRPVLSGRVPEDRHRRLRLRRRLRQRSQLRARPDPGAAAGSVRPGPRRQRDRLPVALI